mmetsp:Transcript_4083/g.13208  ORF Transcript_4083/g.13208 Transcript_4083/m.13208 type:complete len:341 (+) Transcript_4083:107-1129(+)
MTLDSTFVVFNLTSRMCPCTRPHGHASLHKSLSWAPAEDLGLFPPLPSSKQGPASPLPRSATPPLFARLKPPQPPPQKRRRSPHRLHRGLHHLDLVLLVVGLLLHILTHDPVLRKVAPVHRLLEPRRLRMREHLDVDEAVGPAVGGHVHHRTKLGRLGADVVCKLLVKRVRVGSHVVAQPVEHVLEHHAPLLVLGVAKVCDPVGGLQHLVGQRHALLLRQPRHDLRALRRRHLCTAAAGALVIQRVEPLDRHVVARAAVAASGPVPAALARARGAHGGVLARERDAQVAPGQVEAVHLVHAPLPVRSEREVEEAVPRLARRLLAVDVDPLQEAEGGEYAA